MTPGELIAPPRRADRKPLCRVIDLYLYKAEILWRQKPT